MLPASNVYSALAVFVLFLHALFIVWVVFGAFVTRSRPALRWLHVAHLSGAFLRNSSRALYFDGKNWLEPKAGVQPYQAGFLLHYTDKLVYPEISGTVLTVAGGVGMRSQIKIWGVRVVILHA